MVANKNTIHSWDILFMCSWSIHLRRFFFSVCIFFFYSPCCNIIFNCCWVIAIDFFSRLLIFDAFGQFLSTKRKQFIFFYVLIYSTAILCLEKCNFGHFHQNEVEYSRFCCCFFFILEFVERWYEKQMIVWRKRKTKTNKNYTWTKKKTHN